MLHVAAVFGTRPDAIKMAPVVNELRRFPQAVRLSTIATGQHREMLRQVLDVFAIEPDYDLDIMQERQTLGQIASRVLERLDPVLAELKPDVVLLQGDTSTTFVASLAAFYQRAAVGHVEAGLRTDNKYDPFPEEINRRLTTVLADFHFAPTQEAAQNLRMAGVADTAIHMVGNTVIDALLSVAERPYTFADAALEAAGQDGRRVVLVTAHRRENWGEPLVQICAAVRRLAEQFPDVAVWFQMHKNPIVRDIVQRDLAGRERIHLIEPQEYVPWVNLMKRCYLVLTDSGGIQEEAPALGKPVLVMRETTERPEGVTAGTSRLVGTDPETIFAAAAALLRSREHYDTMARATNPYGDGRSAERIREVLFAHYGVG